MQKSQDQRGDHENNGYNGGQLGQKGRRTAAAEDRLARSAEGRSHVGPFTGLQENDHDQGHTHDYMNNYRQSCHNALLINLLDKGQEFFRV